MKNSIIVSLLLVRELVRAILAPVHLLLYLPQRRKWRAAARRVLEQAPIQIGESLPGEFGAGASGGGRVFISAGETSGESHAVKVVQAVRAAGGNARFIGFGGHLLEAEGVDIQYPLSDRAVMGVSGVLRNLPFILGAIRRFLTMLDKDAPDLVVLVDYPGLHLVLARLAKKRGIPVLHYIAPQYWAWGPWRMYRYKRSVSATLTILPFETSFFEADGIPSQYVGHPLLDLPASAPVELPAEPFLCLLPGSRRREILLNLPGMIRAAKALCEQHGEFEVILPHVDPRHTHLIREVLAAHGGEFVQFRQGPIGPFLAAAQLVLAKSGTGSLEACLYGTPTVVVYQLPGVLAAFFARNCLSVPFIASANLIAGQEVVPEFCFRNPDGWQKVEDSVAKLWTDDKVRSRCRTDLAQVRARLGDPGASARVARWILPFCREAS